MEITENGKYIYTSNVANEVILQKRSSAFKYSDYSLMNSYKLESDELFNEFKQVIKDFSREDLLKKVMDSVKKHLP